MNKHTYIITLSLAFIMAGTLSAQTLTPAANEDGQPVWGYYLYDCYPLQYSSDKTVQANREKRAQHWELFTEYLKSKGKLKY